MNNNNYYYTTHPRMDRPTSPPGCCGGGGRRRRVQPDDDGQPPPSLKRRINDHLRSLNPIRHLIFFVGAFETLSAVTCFVMMGVVTHSNYLIPVGVSAALDLLYFIYLNTAKLPFWNRERANYRARELTDEIQGYVNADFNAFCCPWQNQYYTSPEDNQIHKTPPNPFVKWRVWKLIKFVLMIFFALRPFALHRSYYLPPSGSSSCVRNGDTSNQTYNPNGFFPRGSWSVYTTLVPYVFCPLNQTWAVPSTNNYIKGFRQVSGDIIDCSIQEVGGVVDIYNQCPGEDPFPDPTIGVRTPLLPLPNNTGAYMNTICPGNTEATMCIIDGVASTSCSGATRLVSGRPKYICPTCLNYMRMVTGVRSTGMLVGYEDCEEYSDSSASSWPICGMCPGAPWFRQEVATPFALGIAYWGYMVYCIITPLCEIFAWTLGMFIIKNNDKLHSG
jgi:hypothetical protein